MLEIRLATKDDCVQLVNILNEVTLDLLQKGIRQWEYPWDSIQILNQLKRNQLYVLLSEKEMIGRFCIYDIDRINDFALEEKSMYLSQIAILPKFQGKNIGSYIIQFAFSLVKSSNQALYLDCWAGNEKLKLFYSKCGLEYIGDFPENDYFISIFKYR